MVILRATSILGGQKEDKGMMCSITHLEKSLTPDPLQKLRARSWKLEMIHTLRERMKRKRDNKLIDDFLFFTQLD
jgi:hypothetical protein